MYFKFEAKLLSQPKKVALKVDRNYDVSTEDFKSYNVALDIGFYKFSAEQFFKHFSVKPGFDIPMKLLSIDCQCKIHDEWRRWE